MDLILNPALKEYNFLQFKGTGLKVNHNFLFNEYFSTNYF